MAGSVAFLANFSVYLLFLKLGLAYVWASVIGFCLGILVSFLAHKFFTFQNRVVGKTGRQLLMHITLLSFNLVANTAILVVLVELVHVGEILGAFVTNAVIAVWSFLIYKQVVFLNTQENHV